MISKENLRDSHFARFRQLSPTIGQFFASSIAERISRRHEKRPSEPIAQGIRAGHVRALLIKRTQPIEVDGRRPIQQVHLAAAVWKDTWPTKVRDGDEKAAA
jgi:hypothetical protein